MFTPASRRAALRRAGLAGTVLAALTLSACGGTDGQGADANRVEADADAPGYGDLPEQYRDKTISIALDPGFGGLNSVKTGTEEFDGLNADLAKAIAQELGASVELVPASFSAIVVGVESGRFDMSMSAVTDTAERQKTVDFVDYVEVSQALFVPEGNPDGLTADPLSACGLKLSVVPATTDEELFGEIEQECKKAGEKAPTKVSVESVDAAYLALDSGRIDAMIRENSSGREGSTAERVDIDYGTSYYFGAIFAKDEQDLRDAWLAGLEAIVENGEYAEILEENNLSAIELDRPGINLQK